MSVKAIFAGCQLSTGFSSKGAKAQRKPKRKNITRRLERLGGFLCAFAPLREKCSDSDRSRWLIIGLLSVLYPLTASTSRAGSRLRLCGRKRYTRGRVDNERAPDRVSS